MKIISVGNRYEIYDNELKVHDKLPSKNYVVRFSSMSGFYLEQSQEITIKEEKIYGIHNSKVHKVINSFKSFKRNLGVILSGNKGMGKSLFATLLSVEAIKNDLPLIIVDRYYSGIASYLDSINQECVILFDEFDKTFGGFKARDGEPDPQSTMLTLFDGLSQGKKMFVITCNELRSLNDYLINRTGRFHYHFRFEYPNIKEITEYLEDKLCKKYYHEIKNVVAFSRKVDLNFDSLRAIAFEINLGETFANAIKDLNIINLNNEQYYISAYFKNGNMAKSDSCNINLFGNVDVVEYIKTTSGCYLGSVTFNTENCIYDPTIGASVVKEEFIKFEVDNDLSEERMKELNMWEIDYISLVKVNKNNMLHYVV